jgi:CheY-like chemotaxis protein
MTATHTPSGSFPGSEGLVRREVMVVDDEPSVRRMTARLLQAAGYSVHEARDGLEALEFVQAAPTLLDLMVSDVVMPRLDGVALLHRLAASHPDLPCILVSGYGIPQLTTLGIAAPCGILTKPVPPDVLLDEIRRCLRQRH